MILPIVRYPDPILKKMCAPVQSFDTALRTLVDNMFETMYAAPGVGLAAPQVAISQRLLIVDIGRLEGNEMKRDPKVIINPEIVTREGKVVWEEGCLSLPNLIVPVERDKKITVKGKDVDGHDIHLDGEDLLAVAFQHEIDHLDGILLVDRLSRLKRDLYNKERGKNTPAPEPHHAASGPAYIG